MHSTDHPRRQPTPAPGIWFPGAVDTICPECHAPVLGAHQCTPKATR